MGNPPEIEWFADLNNPRIRRDYRLDVKEFTAFTGDVWPEEMRQVTRAHLIARRKRLAVSPSGKPVLLRVVLDAGHGLGSTAAQQEAGLADGWAFVLWQLGDPKFQLPKGPR
jgi:hypothetical protein